MTRWRAVLAGTALVAILAGARPWGQAQQPATTILSIVGTNDLHGGILPREGRGGLALLSAYVNNLRAVRAADGGDVLVIDGGDMFQGTLESNSNEGAAVVAAYNAIGYTAAAIGNHEFDFGPVGPSTIPQQPSDDPRGALKARAAEAKFPFLAANLLDAATGRPVDWPNVKPSILIERAGTKIGVIGAITAEALSATTAANVGGLRVAPLAPAIAAEAASLRSRGAALVILTAHAGGRCTDVSRPADLTSCEAAAEIFDVARHLAPGAVDVIVAGHTHAALAHEVNGIAAIESYSGGRAFGRVDVVVDRAGGRILEKRIFAPRDLCERDDPRTGGCDLAPLAAPGATPARYEGRQVWPDATIAQVLAPTLQQVQAIKARPIGVYLETPVRRAGAPESPLGNAFTDALRDSVPGADIALHNTTGGLRADLPSGPLVYGSIYEVMPFDNKVVPLHLSGAELRRVFTNWLQTSRRTIGISGIRVRAQCVAGKLDVAMLRPSGQAIRDDERVTVAASDFLATGGDGVLTPVLPAGGVPIPDSAPLAREVLAEHLRKQGSPVREAQFVDAAAPRLVLPGPLPLHCGA